MRRGLLALTMAVAVLISPISPGGTAWAVPATAPGRIVTVDIAGPIQATAGESSVYEATMSNLRGAIPERVVFEVGIATETGLSATDVTVEYLGPDGSWLPAAAVVDDQSGLIATIGESFKALPKSEGQGLLRVVYHRGGIFTITARVVGVGPIRGTYGESSVLSVEVLRLPDITLSIDCPAQVKAGQPADVAIRIRNDGGSVPEPAALDITVSAEQGITPDSVALEYISPTGESEPVVLSEVDGIMHGALSPLQIDGDTDATARFRLTLLSSGSYALQVQVLGAGARQGIWSEPALVSIRAMKPAVLSIGGLSPIVVEKHGDDWFAVSVSPGDYGDTLVRGVIELAKNGTALAPSDVSLVWDWDGSAIPLADQGESLVGSFGPTDGFLLASGGGWLGVQINQPGTPIVSLKMVDVGTGEVIAEGSREIRVLPIVLSDSFPDSDGLRFTQTWRYRMRVETEPAEYAGTPVILELSVHPAEWNADPLVPADAIIEADLGGTTVVIPPQCVAGGLSVTLGADGSLALNEVLADLFIRYARSGDYYLTLRVLDPTTGQWMGYHRSFMTVFPAAMEAEGLTPPGIAHQGRPLAFDLVTTVASPSHQGTLVRPEIQISAASGDVLLPSEVAVTHSDGASVEQLTPIAVDRGPSGGGPCVSITWGPEAGTPLFDAIDQFTFTFARQGIYRVVMHLVPVDGGRELARTQMILRVSEYNPQVIFDYRSDIFWRYHDNFIGIRIEPTTLIDQAASAVISISHGSQELMSGDIRLATSDGTLTLAEEDGTLRADVPIAAVRHGWLIMYASFNLTGQYTITADLVPVGGGDPLATGTAHVMVPEYPVGLQFEDNPGLHLTADLTATRQCDVQMTLPAEIAGEVTRLEMVFVPGPGSAVSAGEVRLERRDGEGYTDVQLDAIGDGLTGAIELPLGLTPDDRDLRLTMNRPGDYSFEVRTYGSDGQLLAAAAYGIDVAPIGLAIGGVVDPLNLPLQTEIPFTVTTSVISGAGEPVQAEMYVARRDGMPIAASSVSLVRGDTGEPIMLVDKFGSIYYGGQHLVGLWGPEVLFPAADSSDSFRISFAEPGEYLIGFFILAEDGSRWLGQVELEIRVVE